MTTNEALSDLSIEHALNVLKWSNGVEQKLVGDLLREVTDDLAVRIASRLATIEERGFDIGPTVTRRVEKLYREIREVNERVYSRFYVDLAAALAEFATEEASFHVKALEKALAVDLTVKVPSANRLLAIVTQRPMDGSILKSFVEGMADGTQTRVEKAIWLGMTEGQSIDAIVRRVRGTKAANYRDGVLDVSRRSAQSIVRTSVNHVSNQAAQTTWKANERLIKGWRFIATLDSRTTITCGVLDGTIHPIGEGPIPPRHPGCRSISIAVVKSADELGLSQTRYTPAQRASMDGRVPADTTFETFLKGKSVEFQDKHLGKTRGELFRAGKLDLRDFIRDTGQVIPLEELKRRNKAAFD